MIQIFLSSFLLSIVHASIPNHWLPMIALGKSEKWTNRETMFGTVITGFAHTLSTVVIGIIVGVIGYKLSKSYTIIEEIIAPVILVVLGIIYVLLDLLKVEHRHEHFNHNHERFGHSHSSTHSHHHQHSLNEEINGSGNQKTKWAVLSALSLSMFFTPCIEIEAYYFQASTIGWSGIWIVSAVYTLITVGFMLVLVYLGLKGVKNIRSHFLEEHEKRITGITLIFVGFITYFIKF